MDTELCCLDVVQTEMLNVAMNRMLSLVSDLLM